MKEAPELPTALQKRVDVLDAWAAQRGFVALGWMNGAPRVPAGRFFRVWRSECGRIALCTEPIVRSDTRRVRAMFESRPGDGRPMQTAHRPLPAGRDGGEGRILALPRCADPDHLLAVHTKRMERLDAGRWRELPGDIDAYVAWAEEDEARGIAEAIERGEMVQRGRRRRFTARHAFGRLVRSPLILLPILGPVRRRARAREARRRLGELGLAHCWKQRWAPQQA